MVDKIKVQLGEVQKTLLIPLFGRAKEFEKQHPLIKDPCAREIVEKLDFDFDTVFSRMPVQFRINCAIRAHHLDTALKKLLGEFPSATIVNIGAGLDTTFQRVDNGKVFWYDLDLPDSMELRRKLIAESERNRFIAKSVLDRSWFREIRERRSKIFFMAGGVLVYLKEADVKGLFLDLLREFPGSEIAFDSYAKKFLWVRNHVLANRKKSLELFAPWRWGVDSARALSRWDGRIEVIDEFPYYSRINLREFWDEKEVAPLRIMNFFRLMKMMHLRFGEPGLSE